MSTSFDLVPTFDSLLSETAKTVDAFNDDFVPQTRSADERFGDFQANGVLPFPHPRIGQWQLQGLDLSILP
jgi:hypothetical protein